MKKILILKFKEEFPLKDVEEADVVGSLDETGWEIKIIKSRFFGVGKWISLSEFGIAAVMDKI